MELEKRALENISRINFLNNTLEQVPKIVNINCNKFDRNTNFLYRKEREQQNILDFILSAKWKKSTLMMENSKETS